MWYIKGLAFQLSITSDIKGLTFQLSETSCTKGLIFQPVVCIKGLAFQLSINSDIQGMAFQITKNQGYKGIGFSTLEKQWCKFYYPQMTYICVTQTNVVNHGGHKYASNT